VLLRHAWPGNVRELENVISAHASRDGDFIDLADLPEHCAREAHSLEGDDWKPLSLEAVRKVHIQRVLEMCQGNRLRAAAILESPDQSYRYSNATRGHKKRKSGSAVA